MADQLALFGQPQQDFTTDDYYTPRWIFDALGVTFDLDVASPPGGPPFTPCRRYYTQADDGLASPWEGLVWMNPPYSKPAPWVDKFLRHGNGIALLPYAKSKWLQALWDSEASHLYVYSIQFVKPDGDTQGSTPFPLGIWAVGPEAVAALQRSNLGKVR
jgi:phage N-6-adenine-methyltransferase